nr:hypothetical protein GCM10020063_058540 [Dactylosporangium thailandense]
MTTEAVVGRLAPDSAAGRAHRAALALSAAGAVLGMVVLACKSRSPSYSAGQLVVDATAGYLFLTAGVVASLRRPANRVGLLMILVGVGYIAEDLRFVPQPAIAAVGVALALASNPIAAHLLLAFPSGRLPGPVERRLVTSGYLLCFGLHPLGVLLGRPELLPAAAQPQLLTLHARVVNLLGTALIIGVVLTLGRRWISATRPMRGILTPVFAAAALAGTADALTAAFDGLLPLHAACLVAYQATLSLIPLAFLAGVLHAHLGRTALATLLVELQRPIPVPRLRDLLSRTLGDPSLTIAYRYEATPALVAADGSPLAPPPPGTPVATTEIDRSPRRATVLVHDAALRDDPTLLAAVCSAARLALADPAPAPHRPARPVSGLSEREHQILALMAEGHSNQAIARQLFLGHRTVESHIRTIFQRLGLPPEPDQHRRVLAVLTYLAAGPR